MPEWLQWSLGAVALVPACIVGWSKWTDVGDLLRGERRRAFRCAHALVYGLVRRIGKRGQHRTIVNADPEFRPKDAPSTIEAVADGIAI
jgi:hypothetical protein